MLYRGASVFRVCQMRLWCQGIAGESSRSFERMCKAANWANEPMQRLAIESSGVASPVVASR